MKKILIITQGISRIVRPLCNCSICEVVGLIECAPREVEKQDNIFLKWLKGIHRLVSFKADLTLKAFAANFKIPYYYMTSSSIELENWIRELKPDLIVVYSMSQLLRKNIYTIPRLGTINLHPSYLPEYRGPNPVFWIYYDMVREGGVTVHYIDDGEDTGKILMQERYTIPLGIKSSDNFDIAIDRIGIRLLLEVIQNIEQIEPIEQSMTSSTMRARNLKLNEHRNIIDWNNWPIERVWHVLRGTESWLNALPTPQGIYRGSRWVIGEFEKKQLNGKYKIGSIYKRKAKRFVVCRDGIIYIECKINLKQLFVSLIKNGK